MTEAVHKSETVEEIAAGRVADQFHLSQSLSTVTIEETSARRATDHPDPPFAFPINRAGERKRLQTVGGQ